MSTPVTREVGSSTHVARAARGGMLNLAAAAVAGLSSFALAAIATNGQSQSSAGVFFVSTSLFLLATNVGQLGVNTGVIYFLARSRSAGRLRNAPVYMRMGLTPVVVVGVCIAVAMWVWAGDLADLMTKGETNPDLVTSIRSLAPFVPLAAVLNVALAGTRGFGTMRASATVDQLGRNLLQLALAATAVFVAPTLMAAFWGVAYLPMAVVAWLWWRSMCRRAVDGQPPDVGYRPRRAFWAFSLPRGLAGIAQVAMSRLDVILVGSIAGIGPAAVYAATSRFLSLGLLANGAISTAVQPLLGESLARHDIQTTRDLYQKATSWLVIGAWPVYLTLMVFAPTVLGVFGNGYEDGRPVLTLLALAMLIGTGCGMVSMVLMMAGKTSWNLANVLLALGVNLGLDLWLIPKWGIMGAATGWLASILLANLVPLVQVVSVFDVHPFGRSTLLSMSLAGACTGLLPWLISLRLGQGAGPMAIAVGSGIALYVVVLWRWRKATGLSELLVAVRRRPATG